MSVQEIRARVAALEAQFRPLAPPATATRPATPSNAVAPQFTELLAEATGAADEQTPGDWATRLPAEGQAWAGRIEAAAKRAGIDPRLLASVAWTESGFRPDARSSAGASGMMQLMPGTARGLGVDPADPVQNLEGGARYLAAQLQRFGREDLALAAYNAGPAAVARHGGIPPYEETRNYVQRVLTRVKSL